MTPRPPILAIDVGNSRVKAGAFGPAPAGGLPQVRQATAFPVGDPGPVATLAAWIETLSPKPETALLAGVNPRVVGLLRDGWHKAWPPLTVLDRPPGDRLANRTDAPGRVGSDRLFDALAANRLRPPGASAVIVGAGTATTVNLVDPDGAFLGGAILAGFEIVASALHERTALLPRIDATDLAPPPPLGPNTEAALRSGLYWGLVGGVKELVARLSDDAARPSGVAPALYLTGGAAPLLEPHLPAARVEPHLTLQGMILSV